ncbi:outer membrane beta-barrel protein [Terrimonas pollutisoli]|uniref:outer membrane beta-barrel protein n=1 Tax=Terrimonas pollutisoli TaxID=3034147 RepID=UPI0023EDFB72|nr:outer membrane beta-barrel protein [Terrimonas sp. H1YJ31]
MKKIIVCATLSSVAFLSSYAQNSSAILRGGVNLANVSVTDNGGIDDAKMLTSFQVGILGDINLTSFLALQPGLTFTGKGTKTQRGKEGDAGYFRATSNPYYVEVPVNLVFKTPTGQSNFFIGAGPYIAMGIAGKNKIDGRTLLGATYHSERNIEWSNDDPTTLNEEEGSGFGIMKRFDYGLNGTVGIEASKMVISANYGLGLAKLQSGSGGSGDDNNNKHRVLSFTLGFRL